MTSAIILAAGAGKRLGIEKPKCLLEVGGRSLLSRYLEALSEVKIAEVAIIAGNQSALISSSLKHCSGNCSVEVIRSPYRTKGALSSLSAALERGISGPVLLMDSDVLFPIETLAKLLNSTKRNALLVDQGRCSFGEEMMVGVDEWGRITEVGRVLRSGFGHAGESLGLAFLDEDALGLARVFCDQQRRTAEWDSLEWEVALSSVVGEVDVWAVDVVGTPWIEIDFPEDLSNARRLAGDVDRLNRVYKKGVRL